MNLNKINFVNLSQNEKIVLIYKIYKKIRKKLKNSKVKILNKRILFISFLKRLKKKYSLFFKNLTRKTILKSIKFKTKLNKKALKSFYKKDNKFLTKRFKKILSNFPKIKSYDTTRSKIKRRLAKMNSFVRTKKMVTNFSKKTFFFKIIRKKRRHRLKVFRLNNTKPIFTKETKKEKKFLIKSRESLLKTKKFLYRKKFPKIKGKKNKNFNFFYYNNMDRAPFKFHIGRIVITYLLNNTFINIHNSKKMLKVISAGRLGFKGPKRSTAYSRQLVARKAINFVARTKMNVLDIFLNSNYNRWYYFLFKEISKPRVKPYVIRYLIISNSRPHGFIRDRKHRRK